MSSVVQKAAEIRKALISAAGAVTAIGAAIADPNAATITVAITTVLAAIGVHQVPNAKKRAA